MAQGAEGERGRCGASSAPGFCSCHQEFPGLECLLALHLLHWAPPATNHIESVSPKISIFYLQLDLSQVSALCLLHPGQVPLVLSSGFPPRVGQGEVEQGHFRLAVLSLCVLVRLRGLLCFWGHLRKMVANDRKSQICLQKCKSLNKLDLSHGNDDRPASQDVHAS